MISNFVRLPGGAFVRPAAVTAVYPTLAVGPEPDFAVNPAVVVDYVFGDKGNSLRLHCASEEERDLLVASIRAQVWEEV